VALRKLKIHLLILVAWLIASSLLGGLLWMRTAVADERAEYPQLTMVIDRYRADFDRPIDRELVLTLEVDDLPLPIERSMAYDWVYFNPVEWTGTMPRMNWATSGEEVAWVLREPSTGRELYVTDGTPAGTSFLFEAIAGPRDAAHYQYGSTYRYPRPVVAGDKVYFTAETGEIFVLKAGTSLELLATNELDEITMATPAIARGMLLFRTRDHVVAIGGSE